MYIAAVAKSELYIWKASSDSEHALNHTDFDSVFADHPRDLQEGSQSKQDKAEDAAASGDALRQSRYQRNAERQLRISKPSNDVKEAISLLNKLIKDQPKNILASIKLWQLYRMLSQQSGESLVQKPGGIPMDSLHIPNMAAKPGSASVGQFDYFGCISGHYDSEENKELAMQAAESMHKHYYNQEDEDGEDLQASQRLKHSGHDIEKQMLITLVNVKSLYDIGYYRDCFEMLQSEYLRNSSYTSLLYLYGKYIIKSNTLKGPSLHVQRQFLGSGIGAMEESLKACMPEFHCRIKYYIGLAYNNTNMKQKMPLKTMNYWHDAKGDGFLMPIQGQQK